MARLAPKRACPGAVGTQTPVRSLVRGAARPEGDYIGVLLDLVTLEDGRDVMNNAKTAAQAGDPQARAWLAQYLMGNPEGKAPTPLTMVVAQLNGVERR